MVTPALTMQGSARRVRERLDPGSSPIRFADAAEALLDGSLRRETART